MLSAVKRNPTGGSPLPLYETPKAAASSTSSSAASMASSWWPGGESAKVAFIIVMSIASSVSLILVNKTLMREYKYSFVFTLTGLHFFIGGTALTVTSKAAGLFPLKSIGFSQNVAVAISGVSSIAFMNFSLQSNSVGTYQLLKLCVIPVVMVIQWMFFNTSFSLRIKASLAILLLGVGIATINDVSMSATGMVLGVVAVLATAHFNIWQGSKQKEHAVTSTQLMQSISYYQAALCWILGFYFDILSPKVNLFAHDYSAPEMFLILLSCALATSVNMCSMGLIGQTSAVTYQVVGHVKTCLVIIGGYVLFPPDVQPEFGQIARQLFGVILAMGGVFAYSYFKLQPPRTRSS